MVIHLGLYNRNFGVFVKVHTKRKDMVESAVRYRYVFGITIDNASIPSNDDVELTDTNMSAEERDSLLSQKNKSVIY